MKFPIKPTFFKSLPVLILVFLPLTAFKPASQASHSLTNPNQRLSLNEAYGKLPLAFEPNQGQTDPQVRFLTRGNGYSLFLTDAGAVLALHKTQAEAPPKAGRRTPKFSRFHRAKPAPPDVIRLTLSGASSKLSFQGLEKLPGISNYFIGHDPAKWRTRIPQYAQIQAREVYPGVDMTYYGRQGKLEYDFKVKPGADPGVIRMRVEGADKTEVDGEGNLEISVGGRKLVFRAPSLYQGEDNARTPVEGKFTQTGADEIGFEAKDYDKTRPLIIDPVLDYSTYLGGIVQTGIESQIDFGIAVDSDGNAYVTGGADTTFPATSGTLQTTQASGASDAYVAKLNASGTALVYSTYLGGSYYDVGSGIAVDSNGNAYVAGYNGSTDFPYISGSYVSDPNFDPTFILSDIFVAELNSTGTSLDYTCFMYGLPGPSSDGTSNDEQPMGIVLDSNNNAYIAGYTNSSSFPTTSGAFWTSNPNLAYDTFVFKLNSTGTSLVYSTYLGGSLDTGCGIALDSKGDAFVTGFSNISSMPTTPEAYQPQMTGMENSFVFVLNPAGSGLVYGTYLGGNTDDQGYAIAVNGAGNAYVAGYTQSTYFPTTSGAFQTTLNGAVNSFVSELNPSGTGLVCSTYLGGSNADVALGIALNSEGNVYVTGGTGSIDFPISPTAYQSRLNGSENAFFTVLNPGCTGLVYSTYLGGGSTDDGQKITTDPEGNAYLTGYTDSTNFPTTSGAIQNSNTGGGDSSFVAKFDASILSGTTTPVPATPTSTPSLSPTSTPSSTTTASPTGTPQVPSTITPLPFFTFTPSPTPTPSSTTQASPTATPTFTPSWTLTASPTMTPTWTGTVVQPPTSTATETATWTPTSTISPQATASSPQPTNTPTPSVGTELTAAVYPNPATTSSVSLVLNGFTLSSDVTVQIFTTSFRKVQQTPFTHVTPGQRLVLTLSDQEGQQLANGLYYVAANFMNSGYRTLTKLLILR